MSVRFILPVTREMPFLTSSDRRRYKLVMSEYMYVTPYWIIFTLDLVLSYTDKLLVFCRS